MNDMHIKFLKNIKSNQPKENIKVLELFDNLRKNMNFLNLIICFLKIQVYIDKLKNISFKNWFNFEFRMSLTIKNYLKKLCIYL